jgi:hypothetical protein
LKPSKNVVSQKYSVPLRVNKEYDPQKKRG